MIVSTAHVSVLEKIGDDLHDRHCTGVINCMERSLDSWCQTSWWLHLKVNSHAGRVPRKHSTTNHGGLRVPPQTSVIDTIVKQITALQGDVEGGWCRGKRKERWGTRVKEWTGWSVGINLLMFVQDRPCWGEFTSTVFHQISSTTVSYGMKWKVKCKEMIILHPKTQGETI